MCRDGFQLHLSIFFSNLSNQKSPLDVRAGFYNNILISGGTTMFPGFPTRLYNELNSIFLNKVLKGDAEAYKKSKIKFKIIVILIYKYQDPARRKYNVFIGSSFLADVMKD